MRWLLAALCSGVLACLDGTGPGSASGTVHIKSAATAYQAGTAATVTITNVSGQKLRYSPCFYHLEQEAQDGKWQLVYRDQHPCPAVLEFLDPFATRETSLILPENLELATYRARFPEIGVRGGGKEPFVPAAQVGGRFVVQP